VPNVSKHFAAFHGTKTAQNDSAIVEKIGLSFLSEEAHNLKVRGSNPLPATKLPQ
jgi:hypothetical protein